MSDTKPPVEAAGKPFPVIDAEECKGCGRCVDACPKKVLHFRGRYNRRGINPAEYAGTGCTGCFICFYTCPEPYAIEVHTPVKARTPQPPPAPKPATGQ